MLFMIVLTALILIAIVTTCICDKRRPSGNQARYGQSFAKGNKKSVSEERNKKGVEAAPGASENLIAKTADVEGPVAINPGSDDEQEEEIVNVSGSVDDDE